MKIRQNLEGSNQTNQAQKFNKISKKSSSFSENNTQQLLTQSKKNQLSYKFIKQNKQNIPTETSKQDNNQQRKTIQTAIKELLKGQQALFNYLQSQKQFISVLDSNNLDLKNIVSQRGKLASRLTENKKSRNDTYFGTKSKLSTNLKKIPQSSQNQKRLPQYFQNQITSTKVVRNSAVTVEVINKDQNPHLNKNEDQIQSKHYETISFNKYKIKNKEKYQKQNSVFNQKSFQKSCLPVGSPEKKNNQIYLKQTKINQKLNANKFGLTNFSPWALPKDSHKNDSDFQIDSPQRNQQPQITIHIKSALNHKNQSLSYKNKKGVQYSKIYATKKQKLLGKSFQIIPKISTAQQNIQQKTPQKVNQASSQIKFKTKQSPFEEMIIPDEKITEKPPILLQNVKETKEKSVGNKKQNIVKKKVQDKNQNKKSIYYPIKTVDHASLMKSSQVVILQGQPQKVQQIFASKCNKKQYINPLKGLRKQSRRQSIKGLNQQRIFQTEVVETQFPFSRENEEEGSFFQNNQIVQVADELVQQNGTSKVKKTEEFLKQIIIAKNNPISSATASKKQLKRLPHILEQLGSQTNLKNVNIKLKTQEKYKTQCDYLETNLNYYNKTNQKKLPIFENNKKGKQNYQTSEIHQGKKAKTSLGDAINQNYVYHLISNSNTKYLTEASSNGDSKVNSQKNTFIRRKRHSMLLKNRKNSNCNQTKTDNQKKHSLSMDTDVIHKVSLNLMQQATGFRIVNPLTKQLYKKYVSIVQHKRS